MTEALLDDRSPGKDNYVTISRKGTLLPQGNGRGACGAVAEVLARLTAHDWRGNSTKLQGNTKVPVIHANGLCILAEEFWNPWTRERGNKQNFKLKGGQSRSYP